ncbi:Zinc finger C2H2-type,Zinc finger, RING/FYVE/PHD-type [Cinara cedri]|uniref:Zinc finger C2H2-type,Zinc finger, RING/FYVE/PHD-type n=1 Tax=Cinara cedri TaxID=506608 RepID=A0A5E4MM82_9HEMI|nr:Zinc finger C2H2-type,Zinc finger, RING/FYVE/PHD-type [Cinara cedri]
MVKHLCPFENCSSTFSRPSRLLIHIQRHQGIKGFQCTQCDRGYHRRQHLKRHVAEAHQNQLRLEQLLTCNHCERQFKTAWGLRRHQIKIKRQKANIRLHCCEICNRKFLNSVDLGRHSLKHESFKCVHPSCPLLKHQFISWKFYNQHMIDYHSEPFECEHCGEKFIIKSKIRSHVKEHMPKFNCTQPGCHSTFDFAKNLVKHIQVGHGERTYKCNIIGCDWTFKYKICFERHIKAHQQNKKIFPMANRIHKKEPKFLMATKLAKLALKI